MHNAKKTYITVKIWEGEGEQHNKILDIESVPIMQGFEQLKMAMAKLR